MMSRSLRSQSHFSLQCSPRNPRIPLRLAWILLALLNYTGLATAQYPQWKHAAPIYILTTPAGADLPAAATVKDFPLLVRLHSDHFPFSEANDDGSDIRFSMKGESLDFEIDEWDPNNGTASIWVLIPTISGNERKPITIHWGKTDAQGLSNSESVFDPVNEYAGVWHLGDEVRDVSGNLTSVDRGTTSAAGMIGHARHFPGKKGIFCGTEITSLPSGETSHTTQTWFRPDSSKGRIIAWGNESGQGKVTMLYQSPPGIRMDCYFSNGDVRAQIPNRSTDWTHVVNTFENGQATLYINGQKQATGNPRHSQLKIAEQARMWIGGWYENYDFVGDIDEVRISRVARSADWVRMEYENQKTLQTLVGPVVQSGDQFLVSPAELQINEGETADLAAIAGGARKIYWSLIRGEQESVIAVDRFKISFNAPRVQGNQTFKIRLDAVYEDGTRSIEVPVTIQETLPDPQFVLEGPSEWDGRKTIEFRPQITNPAELANAKVAKLNYHWQVLGPATIQDIQPKTLILHRAQNSGQMTVKLSLTNGGTTSEAMTTVTVTEPNTDPWVDRTAASDEMPIEGQFYAREESGLGIMHCNGKLKQQTDEVFVRVQANGAPYETQTQIPDKNGNYRFTIKLKPALLTYQVELGTRTNGTEKILHEAGDIVCGDAYLISGQSNALATDTREEAPRVTNPWVRSYGNPRFFKPGERENLWCKPVWKAQSEHMAELGWWGMELANRLVESQQVPIFIVNAARGGTRIDQHQRNDSNPVDLDTIYGRMLWRLQQAQLTHGIRAIIWHQGENDQGAAGPDGGYGWETYERYFVELTADWKQDFPNLRKYYAFQIWPTACAMGRDGNGDMLREVQRSLPRRYSNLRMLSTLGFRPGGGCHYPLEGWSVFAKRLLPLIEQDFYDRPTKGPITSPNLVQAYYPTDARNSIVLEFDQPVVWQKELASEFYLDEQGGLVADGEANGNTLILTLKRPTAAKQITYLKEKSWKQDNLLVGKNQMAAMTFCQVPLGLHPKTIP